MEIFTTEDNKQIHVRHGEYGIEWKLVTSKEWEVIEEEDFVCFPIKTDFGYEINSTYELINYV